MSTYLTDYIKRNIIALLSLLLFYSGMESNKKNVLLVK